MEMETIAAKFKLLLQRKNMKSPLSRQFVCLGYCSNMADSVEEHSLSM